MEAVKTINVEVAYANQHSQFIIPLKIVASATVKTAIIQSEILTQFPEIDLHEHQVGIFSKHVNLDVLLQEGDRIEIYRPLQIDPKQMRRRRAKSRIL